MSIPRRTFLKGSAAVAAGAATAPMFKDTWLSEAHAALPTDAVWNKAPCRFCGAGCGAEVATSKGRIVAVRGDEQSPVNKGLLCAKGYGLALMLYGKDRLTKPQIKQPDGTFKDATWEEALDLIATKWKDLIAKDGPDAVSIYGSGQWTIPEGYAAQKWIKGGIGSNNLEPNARLCMASAVVGFLKTYGIDEPPGCYDDFDTADYFFLWGANMAEMHPMLFNRILQRKQADANVKIINFSTFGHLTDQGADENHLFVPHTDLYLLNAFAQVLVENDLHDKAFIDAHTNIMKDTDGGSVTMTWDEYVTFLQDYTPDKVAAQIGMSAADITRLAKMFGDPAKNCVSTWTMGANQHTRGVWVNNQFHNLHLMTGKVSKPGNSPFSLTGQPSACGTCREVGTFTHRLPSDRLVANADHRAEIEAIWNLPSGTIPSPTDSPLAHATALWGKLAAGTVKSVWVSVSNPMQSLPNLNAIRDGVDKGELFMIVSDMYPTETTKYADVILPSSCWVEKEGMFGNSERRTQHFDKMIDPPGDAKSDVWQFVEVARKMGYDNLFPKSWDGDLEKNLYNEYRECTLGTHHDVATYDDLKATRGLRWPVINGKETKWRFNSKYDSEVSASAVDGIEFYGKSDGKAVIWARPYEAPAEAPSTEYPLWLCTGRVLVHWHTGTMTRRVPQLHKSVPEALVYLSNNDAATAGVTDGDMVKITSIRGSVTMKVATECQTKVPDGLIFVPFFDESKLINDVVLGAVDPQSFQPDYKKCAVKIEKA
jgi:nitrate reductase (cytochrome)